MLSKKVDYGLMAVLHMANQQPGRLVTAKEIAERYLIPIELLSKVLQALARAKVVNSTQGAYGGYELGRGLDDLSLIEVIEAIDGPVSLARCVLQPGTCAQFDVCNIRDAVKLIHQHLVEVLRDISLGAFCRERRSLIDTPLRGEPL